MITYSTSLDSITSDALDGFFSEWRERPSSNALYRILHGSDHVVLALDEERIVGYITAISDGVSCAYIPHLEVREEFRGRGIGSALVERMLWSLGDLYMIDLVCDESLRSFYERQGFRAYNAMVIRNYRRQALD